MASFQGNSNDQNEDDSDFSDPDEDFSPPRRKPLPKQGESVLNSPGQTLTGESMLRARIDEQSTLISLLKHRANETIIQNKAVNKINSELENEVDNLQTDIRNNAAKLANVSKNLDDLTVKHEATLSYLEEQKAQNTRLSLENQQLRSEIASLSSKSLQDKEALFQSLQEELKQLKETCRTHESDKRRDFAKYEATLREQASQHKNKEEAFCTQMHIVQQLHADAMDTCRELKMKLADAEKHKGSKDTSVSDAVKTLTADRDKYRNQSKEKSKEIQSLNEEIDHLEKKLEKEKKARLEQKERYEEEIEALNTNARVKKLQTALDESTEKLKKLTLDFDAFTEHSTKLLEQERSLNKKLRDMLG